MSYNDIKNRIFIIGTARSGTTLLQSMLASHSEIFTLPETHFFDNKLYKQKILRFLNIIDQAEATRIKLLFQAIDNHDILKSLDFNKLYSKKKWGKILFEIMDFYTINNNKSNWVEKTPLNLYYVDLINKIDKSAKFIHIVRNAEDNIASLYEAGKKNSNYFAQDSIDKCIVRYSNEYYIHRKYLKRINHFFINYDNLISDAETQLSLLCNFIDIKYEPNMMEFASNAKKIISNEENWKSKNLNSELSKSNKKLDIFTKKELEYIKQKTGKLDLRIFE